MEEDQSKRQGEAQDSTRDKEDVEAMDKEPAPPGTEVDSGKKKDPPRKFLTRAGAAMRRKQEQTVWTQVAVMEQDPDLGKIEMHELLLKRSLATLEHLHLEYMGKNKLDPNTEPEKS